MYRGSDWDYRNDRYSDPRYRMDKYDDKDKWFKRHHRMDHHDMKDERKDRFRRDFDNDKDWKKKDKHHHHHHHECKDDECKMRDKHHDKKWKPFCDIGETDEYWMIRAELPGVRKDCICVEMEGKDLIICGKKKKEFWHDKLLKRERGPKHNPNCSCGDSCTCHPTCKCGVSTISSKDEKGKTIEASLKGDVKDTERKGDLKEHRKDMKRDEHITWWKKERGGKGKFKRKVHLPKRVDHSVIEALYKDGVLEVLIKKPMGEKKLTEGHTIPVH